MVLTLNPISALALIPVLPFFFLYNGSCLLSCSGIFFGYGFHPIMKFFFKSDFYTVFFLSLDPFLLKIWFMFGSCFWSSFWFCLGPGFCSLFGSGFVLVLEPGFFSFFWSSFCSYIEFDFNPCFGSGFVLALNPVLALFTDLVWLLS